MYRSGSFENLTFGIKDKSIFNIPPECRGTSVVSILPFNVCYGFSYIVDSFIFSATSARVAQ
jgi:hypothetical protein